MFQNFFNGQIISNITIMIVSRYIYIDYFPEIMSNVIFRCIATNYLTANLCIDIYYTISLTKKACSF